MRSFTDTVSVEVNNATVFTDPFRIQPDAQWIAAVIERVRGTASVTVTLQGAFSEDAADHLTNEHQTVVIDATGGDFTLTAGTETAAIDFDCTAAELQTALEAEVGAGNVEVYGTNPSFVVVFVGDLAGTDVAEMTSDATNLTGGASTATVATTQAGGAAQSDWVDSALTSGAHNSFAPKQLVDAGGGLHMLAVWPWYRFKVVSAGIATVEGRVATV